MQALLTSRGPTIDGVDCTYEEALVLSMVNEALTEGSKNNVAAFNAIMQVLKSEEEAQERRARIQNSKQKQRKSRNARRPKRRPQERP